MIYSISPFLTGILTERRSRQFTKKTKKHNKNLKMQTKTQTTQIQVPRVMPYTQRTQVSQTQREVSWKSANNKKRKAHEFYQAASLPQTIKKGE